MSKTDYLIICVCFVLSCFTFWVGNYWAMAHVEKPTPFFSDHSAKIHLADALILDPNTGNKLDLYATRAFHNKFVGAGDTAFVNLSRATDPTFVFGIAKVSSSYENKGQFTLAYPVELVFFLAAVFFWITKWDFFKSTYLALPLVLIVTLALTVIISPTFYLPKFFPYLVMLRIFIYLTLWKALQKELAL